MHSVYTDRRYLIPFRATLLPQIFTDVLVIGGGVAGMRAALAATEGHDEADVIVVAKGKLKQSNTFWAQGGIAAVISEADSVADHVRDTMVAGAGLCDESVVTQIVQEGGERVRELMDWGMRFDLASEDDSTPALGKEGGHSHHRILHTDGDATGKALGQCLGQRIENDPRIRFFQECFVLDLITADNTSESGGQVLGAITHHPKYGLQVIWAAATVLASGGAGQVYRESTNPRVATGDGVAMAYRAGAELQDLAFYQFHPTTLYIAGASRSLITEAVRGEGAHLIDRSSHRFMPDYDERAELAPRDIVSRSILAQMAKTGHTHVYLDARHLGTERFNERFPGIERLLREFDLDPATDTIPVHPSAHYMIGGVRTDAQGRTSLPGLYAAGEVSCSGLNGANRLASNSLLEGLVLGKSAGEAALEMVQANGRRPARIVSDIRLSERSELDLADVRSSLRSVMWRHVGIEREGDHLKEVGEMFLFWARYTMDKIFDDRLGWEVQNLLTVGALITRAAAWRLETRGTHTRLDYPETSDDFRVHETWVKGQPEPTTIPVEQGAEATK
ncbi:L-aspartate oxidase [Algisphaera agarilytica]|uniref:L-aspartate oxidase n=1 Tax=Algisphaera agarilytica TaxID=1385975 RepID=A0A7X0LN44_9BACT|nr:L-aspartate oxidase [Algisphaera agarilytica]MBB6431643.1 L-aspartate oxidase [Algisphaera agarilytica]